MTSGFYEEVLCSARWWELRSEIVEARGATCEGCGVDGERLELHHVTYENLGEESEEDVVLLCVRCHCSAHGFHELIW